MNISCVYTYLLNVIFLSLTIEGKTYNFLTLESDVEQIDFIITHIGVSLKTIFPSVPLDRLIKKIDVLPHDRLNLMQDMIKDKEKKDPGPCGGFSNMYACMCDYHHLPYRDDVAWDVDTIYLSHDTKELRLKDFDHLQSRDWLPIISTLEYNSWFTGINANNVRLTNDVATEVVKVMKKNSVLEELSVSNTGIKSDLVQKLSVALLSNSGTQLAKVDLSCNVLDDRGVIHFLGSLSKLSRGLTDLDLSKTGLTGKGINKLAETMCGSSVIRNSLKTLKISDNPVKGDDVTNLYRFLSLPNVLTHLDFSGLEIPLEVLSAALLRGCTQHMTHLNLSRNPFTLKKLKDVTIPQSWKQLFSSFYQLSHLDISHCKLPMESVKELLLGISSNMNINSLHLDLSSNELYSSSSDEIDTIIAHMSNLTSLDISNNRFELSLEHFLKSVSQNKTLKHLAIGRNFSGMKVKHIPRVLGAVVHLLQEENSAIESLSLADSKLKGETTLVINALGSNKTLTELDISGNSMEDVGARMLAKALQINNKLQTIIWDKNGTTAQGFQDIADALEQAGSQSPALIIHYCCHLAPPVPLLCCACHHLSPPVPLLCCACHHLSLFFAVPVTTCPSSLLCLSPPVPLLCCACHHLSLFFAVPVTTLSLFLLCLSPPLSLFFAVPCHHLSLFFSFTVCHSLSLFFALPVTTCPLFLCCPCHHLSLFFAVPVTTSSFTVCHSLSPLLSLFATPSHLFFHCLPLPLTSSLLLPSRCLLSLISTSFPLCAACPHLYCLPPCPSSFLSLFPLAACPSSSLRKQ
ncbi:LRRC16 [Acanthosepion pharaonis]|uniref:LRRC16 n=1 Tax=Acanthosepion pharaonis TaxID=158019 RepID=A0A812ECW2_ACAPH|nr:LRRC16 [Sepia pharaonis]